MERIIASEKRGVNVMGQTARVFSNEYVGGVKKQSDTASEEKRFSGAKALSIVILVNVVVAMAIGMIIGEIVLSDIELPAMFGFF